MIETKILITDDEPLNLLLYSEMLKSQGYEIITACDGYDAVEKAKAEQPNLIVMDWNMPRMDGLEALRIIKSDPQFSNTPVIIITGIMTSPENLKLALESDAIDFLRKPFDKMELQARVKSALLLAHSINQLHEKIAIIQDKNNFINALMESIPHPMVYYQLNGIIKGANQRFHDVFEIKNKNFQGMSIYHYLSNNTEHSHQLLDKKLQQTRNDLVYESKAGFQNHDYIISKTLYYSNDDVAEGIMCVMTNITDLKQANKELLENKTRELTSTALRLAHLGEMNNNLISDLEKVHQHTDKKGSELIKAIIKRFGINSGENIWQEFETRFENVYETFYKKLSQQFTELTPGDRKLCALLRLNLSSKDIAALTFQNPQSVDMARYRLRKKLNLGPDVNLTDFLMAIE